MIDEYKFGYISVDDQAYLQDIEVDWDDKVLPWERKESHLIGIEDVKRAAERNPETIVIGTGETGMAEVTEEAQDFLIERGIKLVVDKTEEAVRTFNVINEDSIEEDGVQQKVVGLFHITC